MILALVIEQVQIHVLDAGESPHLVATLGGKARGELLDDRGASPAIRRRSSFGSMSGSKPPRSVSTATFQTALRSSEGAATVDPCEERLLRC